MSAGSEFTAVLVDGERVYVHTNGKLFCLDAKNGFQLWVNELNGLGFETASLAVAGASTSSQAAFLNKQRQQSDAAVSGS